MLALQTTLSPRLTLASVPKRASRDVSSGKHILKYKRGPVVLQLRYLKRFQGSSVVGHGIDTRGVRASFTADDT